MPSYSSASIINEPLTQEEQAAVEKLDAVGAKKLTAAERKAARAGLEKVVKNEERRLVQANFEEKRKQRAFEELNKLKDVDFANTPLDKRQQEEFEEALKEFQYMKKQSPALKAPIIEGMQNVLQIKETEAKQIQDADLPSDLKNLISEYYILDIKLSKALIKELQDPDSASGLSSETQVLLNDQLKKEIIGVYASSIIKGSEF